MSDKKLVLGRIINPVSDTRIDYIEDGALILEGNVKSGYKIKEVCSQERIKNFEGEVLDYTGQVLIPSFYDMHFHWVQDDVREMPKDSLLNWLESYTFPAENKFRNKNYSKKKAKTFFKRLAKVGTLGGACFSSIHGHALEDAMENIQGDFVVGNVLMTMNSPKNLSQSKSDAVKLVKNFLKKYKKRYAITPRFAISTDPETMLETHQLAHKNKNFIQSHLSENSDEINFVLELYRELPKFKNIKSYTDIYDKVKALGPRSLMAHGIHLSSPELKKLAQTKTVIVHCPTSNAPTKDKGLGSGLFDFQKVEKSGVRWVMGSDIGGGPFLSMFDVMHSFVKQNKKNKKATYTKALYRSTLAGAKVMGSDKLNGNFGKGKWANILVLNSVKVYRNDSAEDILKRICIKYGKFRKNYDSLVYKTYLKGQVV